MTTGSYQFENLESRNLEASHLAERAVLRLEGFPDLLIRHGFPTTGKILEVGVGHGIRARMMAEKFPQAQIIGVDRSDELLSEAMKQNQNVPNLSFVEADLYQLPFSNDSFDFIYARLVFMHLTDPITAIQSLKRVLRPGGRILIEDADRDCMFFEPIPTSFSNFWNKVQEGQRRLGGDPNIGRKLTPYFKKMGLQKINTEVQPIIGDGKEIEFLARTLMPSLNIYLEPQHRAEGERAIQDLHHLSRDSSASFYHFWFVVSGEKND